MGVNQTFFLFFVVVKTSKLTNACLQAARDTYLEVSKAVRECIVLTLACWAGPGARCSHGAEYTTSKQSIITRDPRST